MNTRSCQTITLINMSSDAPAPTLAPTARPASAESKKDENKKEEEKKETPAERLLRISRLYFRLGFAFLPWMWAVNALMLLQYRNKPNTPPDVIWYRNWSAICFAISSVLFVIYVVLSWTALEDVVPWVIRPGMLPHRQNGLFSQAAVQPM